MGIIDFLLGRDEPEERATHPSLAIDDWASWFYFNGSGYPIGLNQTMPGQKVEEIGSGFVSLVQGAYKRSGIVFACELVRLMHFAEARFTYRQRRGGRPGTLFGTEALSLLEQPWPGGTTGDLLTKMLVHADFAGNAFVTRRANSLKILRPDWMTIVMGSDSDDDVVSWDPDSELLGYMYHPGGYYSGRDPVPYLPNEMAHFAPVPDPVAEYRGMSWLQPVIDDVMGDQAAQTHKLKFFENGATPNMVVALPISDPEKFEKWIELFNEKYQGASNAYKTMFLGQGADTKVVGADFQQLNFKDTVGVSETRIAAAAGVPPVVVGLSEGLQGSSLNAGNYSSARRRFADGTMRPLWRNVCGSLSRIAPAPSGSELWYDTRDIAFLREDAEVEARIISIQSQAMRQLVDGGFDPDSVISAVVAGDLALLTHTGLLSVQVQEPGTAGVDQNGSQPVEVVPA